MRATAATAATAAAAAAAAGSLQVADVAGTRHGMHWFQLLLPTLLAMVQVLTAHVPVWYPGMIIMPQ
jgi:hypothetical protein